MELTESIINAESTASPLELRRYFKQAPLETQALEACGIVVTRDIIKSASLDSLNNPDDPNNPVVRLESFINGLEEWLDTDKYPPVRNTTNRKALRQQRQQRTEAYREEFKRGVEAMVNLETFIKRQPDLTYDQLINQLFIAQKNGQLQPRQDITNQQAISLFSLGLRYLLDHHLLQLAKSRFDTSQADDFCRFFLEQELSQPDKATLQYQPQVGVVLTVTPTDFQQLYPPEEDNPEGFYFPAGQSGEKLNGQIIVVLADLNEPDRQEIIDHEEDHLWFFKYHYPLRPTDKNYQPEPANMTRRRYQDHPLGAELLLAPEQIAQLETSMATELSAYQHQSWLNSAWANLSIGLEKQLPPSAEEFWQQYPMPKKTIDFFHRPMEQLARRAMEIIYPIARKAVFVQFYRGLMHVEKAQQRGVPREKISAALALTGIKKAHRLDLLEPTDPQQQVNEFTPRGFYTPSGIVEIIPPHLATFFESVLPKNQVNSFWPIESQKTPPVNKKKIISGLKTLYRETLAAGDIGIPLTQQAFAERYSSAASPETKTSKTKLNRQQAAAVASAQILFPEFNRRFFEEAVLQRSPFSPLFYFDFLPDSGSLAKRIKSASCNTTETRERLLDSLIEVNQLPKEPDKFAPRIYPCREHYFQLLFHSRFNYPEDETLWHLIETELIPPLINNSGQTVEMETNGGLTIKGLPNQVIPVIFFRNYLEIKENTAALKPDQAKKKIAAALSEWQEAIKRLKVPVTEHQL